MSEADVQVLLEGLAAELDAPITLEDVEFRLYAHTDHSGVIDEVRRSMIIGRRATAEIRSWFEQWGISEATGPVRTPADTTLRMLERWAVPVRFRGIHLGYLWVLDAGRIAETELEPAIEVARHIGAVLYRRRRSSQIDTDLLRLLLIPNPESASVAAEVRALGTYTHKGPIAVVVAGAANDNGLSPTAVSDLARTVERASAQAPPETVLAGAISDLGVLLTPLRSTDDLMPARRLAERVLRLATHISENLELVAAIGGATKLERASHSYAEARRGLKMVRAMPDLGPIVTWDDLGVFRPLAVLPIDDVESMLDPRVRDLLADEGLAATAETFLDMAGNVQATAARLFVHRTTLYQRLDRIATLYKLDLQRSGDHRLITHLGLKLARMSRLV